MTDREKEEQIRTAIVHAAPNQLDKILSSCQQMEPEVAEIPEARKGRKIAMTKKKNTTIGILSIAVAAVLVLLIGGYSILNGGGRVDSVILLDVNPSLSISINDKERVLSVTALNEDAKVILGDMDLEGTTLEVAVNALIGSMLQKGYLGDAQNSILVSVENQDASRGAALQQRVSAQIAEALRTDSMDGAVLSQTVAADDASLKALAEQYGISIGKASLIQEVIAQDGTLTFEALAPMTINEIALIASSRDMSKQNVITQTGQASASAYIGGDQALAIACADAGVSVADIYDRDVEFDSERGVMVYEVDFKAGTLEYEYEIDAKTGEILRSRSEPDLDDVFDNVFGGGNAGGAGSAGNAGNTDNGGTGSGSIGNAGNTGNNTGNASGYIGEEAALQAALAHAGITDSSSLRETKAELDRENGRMIYEVEFKSGNLEYDYEVDASTGEILKAESEYDD